VRPSPSLKGRTPAVGSRKVENRQPFSGEAISGKVVVRLSRQGWKPHCAVTSAKEAKLIAAVNPPPSCLAG
jgi:hypothetical protein